MKKSFNNILMLFIIGLILGCNRPKKVLFAEPSRMDLARKNIIVDFVNTYKTQKKYLKKRKGKPFDVFWIFEHKSKDSYWIFSISPEIDGYIPMSIKDSLEKVPFSFFPNKYKVERNKLFIWKDTIEPLRKDVISVMEKFGILDSTDIKRELGLLSDDFKDTRVATIDHKLKSVHYYICKERINKYKKVVTNKSLGAHTIPRLNCN